MGGVPNWGYDLGCFQGDTLVWRLHYRGYADRVQIFPPDANGHTPAPQEFKGEGNFPRKSRNQKYALIPCLTSERIQCVRDLFKIITTQVPVIGWHGIIRELAALGHRSYGGKGFDRETIQRMATNPVYIGFKTQGKWTKARHKRFDLTTGGLIDVPDAEKGRQQARPREQWIIPEQPTHAALIDLTVFEKAQELLKKLPKRKHYAPRCEAGYLKPLLYCSGCGRGMVCKTIRGKVHYHCLTSVYRSNRPGDPRFQTECGHNCVAHDALEALILERLDGIRLEVEQAVELGAVKLLEEEIAQRREQVVAAAQEGCRDYFRQLYADLELEGTTGRLTALVERHLAAKSPPSTATLQEVERLKVAAARQQTEQLEEEHRHMTLAQARPGVTDRQRRVWETECRRIEGRLAGLEKHLAPLEERKQQLEAECQELLDRREECLKAMKRGEGRAKGAALARVFSKVLLTFGKENEGWVGRGRRGRIISVWRPAQTQWVYTVEGWLLSAMTG